MLANTVIHTILRFSCQEYGFGRYKGQGLVSRNMFLGGPKFSCQEYVFLRGIRVKG